MYLTYEITRTVEEIRHGRWKRVALQFPDDMLTDAPRVFERLRSGLAERRRLASITKNGRDVDDLADDVEKLDLEEGNTAAGSEKSEEEEKLTILADTSYGACCIDEIAAEHVDAQVVVHYGRTCLSPTARLPVIYVYTTKPLDREDVLATFERTYPDRPVSYTHLTLPTKRIV